MKSGDMQHSNGFGLYAAFSFLYAIFTAAEEFFNAMHGIRVEDVVDLNIIIYTDGRIEEYGTAVNQDDLPSICLFSESDEEESDTSSIAGEVTDLIE
jgi:hypothetical protein